MIYINNFSKKNKYYELNDISLSIKDNRIYGFAGDPDRNLLLHALSGQIKNYRGAIYLDNQLPTDSQLSEFVCLLSDFRKSSRLYHMSLSKIAKQFRQLNKFFHLEYCTGIFPQFGFDENTPYGMLTETEKSVFRALLTFCTASPLVIIPIHSGSAMHKELLTFIRNAYDKNPQTIILSTDNYQTITSYVTDLMIFRDRQMILNDDLFHLSNNGYRISHFVPTGKNIVWEEHIDGISTYYVYDQLSTEELYDIEQHGGMFKSLNHDEILPYLVNQK